MKPLVIKMLPKTFNIQPKCSVVKGTIMEPFVFIEINYKLIKIVNKNHTLVSLLYFINPININSFSLISAWWLIQPADSILLQMSIVHFFAVSTKLVL